MTDNIKDDAKGDNLEAERQITHEINALALHAVGFAAKASDLCDTIASMDGIEDDWRRSFAARLTNIGGSVDRGLLNVEKARLTLCPETDAGKGKGEKPDPVQVAQLRLNDQLTIALDRLEGAAYLLGCCAGGCENDGERQAYDLIAGTITANCTRVHKALNAMNKAASGTEKEGE